MKLTKSTTNAEAAALMGGEADSLDGCILIGLLYRAGVDDTDELTPEEFYVLMNESQRVRNEYLSTCIV